MGVLVARDNVQLRRIDSAIARIESRSLAEQHKIACLLEALRSEQAEILGYNLRARKMSSADRRGSAIQPPMGS
jgi:hypothetical protein